MTSTQLGKNMKKKSWHMVYLYTYVFVYGD